MPCCSQARAAMIKAATAKATRAAKKQAAFNVKHGITPKKATTKKPTPKKATTTKAKPCTVCQKSVAPRNATKPRSTEEVVRRSCWQDGWTPMTSGTAGP